LKEVIDQLDKTLDNKLPTVFLINKQDVDGCLNKNQIKEFVELDKLDSNFIWTIKESIGYTGMGCKEAINFIISNLIG
jgi:hypothetical protein